MSTRPSKKKASGDPLGQLPAELQEVIRAASSKKASQIIVLDLRAGSAFTDFFVICSAQNTRQAQAVVEAIEETLKKSYGQRASHVEGASGSDWVLLDYFDFIIHVFTPEAREFYALERLWGSAERIEVPEERPTA